MLPLETITQLRPARPVIGRSEHAAYIRIPRRIFVQIAREIGQLSLRTCEICAGNFGTTQAHNGCCTNRNYQFCSHFRLLYGEWRSEAHTSELQALMRISYAGICLTQKKER